MLDPYIESVLIFTGINIVLALGLYLPVSAGLLSLGQGGFMAIGAYTAAYLTTEMQWPFVMALLVWRTDGRLRRSGRRPAFASDQGHLSRHHDHRVRRDRRRLLPEFRADRCGLRSWRHPRTYHLAGASLSWSLLTLLLCFQIRGSRIGRAIEAVREDELAAEVIGINLTYVKVAVFGLGAAIAGIGGGLYAHYATFIDPAPVRLPAAPPRYSSW